MNSFNTAKITKKVEPAVKQVLRRFIIRTFPVRQRIRGWSQRIEVTMEINKGGSASGVLKRKKKTSDGEKNNDEK